MKIRKYINHVFFILFPIVLALGQYNPFSAKINSTENNILPLILSLIFIIYSTINGVIIRAMVKYKDLLILLCISLFTFNLSSISYASNDLTTISFNYKFFTAIILFILFSYYLSNDFKLCIFSILIYAITMGIVVLAIRFDYFSTLLTLDKGRLIFNGENPNSTSTRVAIAALILLFIAIENPLNFNKMRFLLLLFLPGLVIFVIQSASIGSFIVMISGMLLISFYSKIDRKIKILLSVLILSSLILIIAESFDKELLYKRLYKFYVSGNSSGRQVLWKESLQIFYDYPLWGVGENGYLHEMKYRYGESRDTHNLIIYILVSGGLFAFLPFVAFLYTLFKKCILIINQFRFPLILLFSILVIAFKTGGVLTYLLMWYFFAVINSFNFQYQNHVGAYKN